MKHNNKHSHEQEKKYTLADFIPLIVIFSIIILFTFIKQFLYGWDIFSAMYDFMGSFFIVFGTFKILNLQGFVDAYAMYDIIAKRSRLYGYMYPFFELGLGIAYVLHSTHPALHVFTFFLMIMSAFGVAQELLKGRRIMCACLGTVFKIPMTYVTLAEDLLMAVMALLMLIYS